MRVVDEGAGAGWRHPRYKRRPGRDRGRDLRVRTTPSGDSIEIAFQFDSMTVNGCGILEPVHYLDLHPLTARQHDRRSNQTRFFRRALRLRIVTQLEGIAGCTVAPADLELQLTIGVPFGMGGRLSSSVHGYAQYELSHTGRFVHRRVLVRIGQRW